MTSWIKMPTVASLSTGTLMFLITSTAVGDGCKGEATAGTRGKG